MFWQVHIPKDKINKLGASVTVEAENWFTALREGLEKHGADEKSLSNLSCNINPDRSVTVTDFVTHRVYRLTPMENGASNAATKFNSAVVARLPVEEGLSSTDELTKRDDEMDYLPPHRVFYSRDEEPDDGSGIFYRERLIEVAPGFSTTSASQLAHFYYGKLKELGANNGSKLYITVHIFDHAFRKRSLRPAVAALTWKEWYPKKPKIVFPLSGKNGVTLSKVPKASSALNRSSAEPPRKSEAPLNEGTVSTQAKDTSRQIRKSEAPLNEGTVSTQAKDTSRQIVVSETHSKAPDRTYAKEKTQRTATSVKRGAASSVEEKMVEAFERMQDIYSERTHDGAAAFTLALSYELIACEAGCCMLITPGNYALYVSAVEGKVPENIRGKDLSLTEGIVGFSTRTSVVVNISDPQNDERFQDSFDFLNGEETRNVLCAPVQHEGHTTGVIELRNSSRKEGFSQEDTNILSYLCGALAEYLNTSLPSRERDFSDRDFMVPLRTRTANNVRRGVSPRTNNSHVHRTSRNSISVHAKSNSAITSRRPSPSRSSVNPRSVAPRSSQSAGKMDSTEHKNEAGEKRANRDSTQKTEDSKASADGSADKPQSKSQDSKNTADKPQVQESSNSSQATESTSLSAGESSGSNAPRRGKSTKKRKRKKRSK